MTKNNRELTMSRSFITQTEPECSETQSLAREVWAYKLLVLHQNPDKATDELFLEVFCDLRDAGILPKEATFYLIGQILVRFAWNRIQQSPQIQALRNRMAVVWRASGYRKHECSPVTEMPEECSTLAAQEDRSMMVILRDICREHGEVEMADLCEGDGKGFWHQMERGLQYWLANPHALPGDNVPGLS